MIVIFFLNKSQLDEREYTNLLVSCRGLALRDPKKSVQKRPKGMLKACKKATGFLAAGFLAAFFGVFLATGLLAAVF